MQLALDTLTLEKCMTLLQETRDSVGIAEMETPFIIEEGMRPVRESKQHFPEIGILADAKVMGTGELETETAFKAGAGVITILGMNNDETVPGTVETVKRYNEEIMIDMATIKGLEARAKEIDVMGVDYICVHTAFGVQQTGRNPLDELMIVNRAVMHVKSAAAGGAKLATINMIAPERAAVVVVGGAIYNTKDRATAVKEVKQCLR